MFIFESPEENNSICKLNSLKLLFKCHKKRQRAWTPGRFFEVASHGKDFSFFFVFLKKISINCRFFTQKEHLPAQKKRSFARKK